MIKIRSSYRAFINFLHFGFIIITTEDVHRNKLFSVNIFNKCNKSVVLSINIIIRKFKNGMKIINLVVRFYYQNKYKF